MKILHATLITLIVVFLLPAMAHADPIVSLAFVQPAQSVQQGGTLTFSGILSVSGDPDTIDLVGDSIQPSPGFGIVGFDTPSPELLMLDDLPFLLNFPFQISSVDPNNPWMFDFFTVSIGAEALPGTYLGTFDILGGAFGEIIVASSTFRIDVAAAPVTAPVPEPNTFVLLSTGIVAFGILRRFKFQN